MVGLEPEAASRSKENSAKGDAPANSRYTNTFKEEWEMSSKQTWSKVENAALRGIGSTHASVLAQH